MAKKVTTHFGDLSMVDLMYARPEEDCAVLVLVTAGYVTAHQRIRRTFSTRWKVTSSIYSQNSSGTIILNPLSTLTSPLKRNRTC